jgi:Poly(hydroxyalcanoate) granule associated protein (phasin)
MRTTIETRFNPVGDAVMNASRQVWLASLGAAVVTREWAQTEASNVFRTLVKEGTAVESRTIRIVGTRLEDSFAAANTIWKQARTTVSATVRQAADTAVTLVQNNLPKSLPMVTLPSMLSSVTSAKGRKTSAKRGRPAKRVATKRAVKAVKRGTRKTRGATKK